MLLGVMADVIVPALKKLKLENSLCCIANILCQNKKRAK